MLEHLTISNYAIAADIDLEFGEGMTVITGETGAGKSITLDALGLALGDRADSAAVRAGAKRAEVTAAFDVADSPAAKTWLAERELTESDDCILRRVVSAEGRSKAFINGRPVTLQELRELGETLIDIHGQHAHQRLMHRSAQRELLDAYAGATVLAEEVRTLFSELLDKRTTLERVLANSEEQNAKFQLLSYQVGELDRLDLGDGELDALDEEHKGLANAEEILAASHRALEAATGEDGAAAILLRHAIGQLEHLPQRSHALEEALQMLNSAAIQVDEAAASIQSHVDGFEIDPERLAAVEERLSAIYDIARKHRVPPAELDALAATLRAELAELDGGDERIAALERELTELQARYDESAAKLSAKRKRAAAKLQKAVAAQLAELKMGNCSLELQLKPEEQPTAHGRENVEIRVGTNPGQPLQPLAKIASGGELSRIGLAIQVVCTQTQSVPTLVFDEVDAGIGGGVAELVGNLLRRLGEHGQVFCVTHLPQVACKAHHHYVVSKDDGKRVTATRMVRLDDDGKVEEIARMLGGIAITEQTLAHAKEMLALRH